MLFIGIVALNEFSFFIYSLKVFLPALEGLTYNTIRDKIINCEVLQPTWEDAVREGNEDNGMEQIHGDKLTIHFLGAQTKS